MKAQKINAKSLGSVIIASIGFSKNLLLNRVQSGLFDGLLTLWGRTCLHCAGLPEHYRAGPSNDFTLKTVTAKAISAHFPVDSTPVSNGLWIYCSVGYTGTLATGCILYSSLQMHPIANRRDGPIKGYHQSWSKYWKHRITAPQLS